MNTLILFLHMELEQVAPNGEQKATLIIQMRVLI